MSAGRAYPHGIGLVLPLLYVRALAWPAKAEGKPGSARAEPPTQYAGVDACRACPDEVYKGLSGQHISRPRKRVTL